MADKMRKISLQVNRKAVSLQSRTRKLSLQVAGKPSVARANVKPFPKFGTDFVVHVTTGDKDCAGTDSNVFVRLFDGKGNQTEAIKLDRPLKNDLERGSTDSFPARGADGFGNIERIELWRDNFGVSPDWYLERIVVEHRSRTRYVFPLLRWVQPERHYMVYQYDCSLPQDDRYPEERRQELEHRRRRLKKEQQQLSEDTKEPASEKQRKKLLAKVSGTIPKWPQKPWTALYDMRKLFKSGLDEPMCAAVWRDDVWFGQQRLEGVCPRLIRACSKLPDKLAVTEAQLLPALEGGTLSDCLAHGRLFTVDLGLLHGLRDINGHEMVAPVGLFLLNRAGELVPLAIQLFQRPGPNNPVFLSTDKGYVWTVAKMFFNMAEAQYQYGFLYRGVCVEMMSYVAQCTEQLLSPSHPIYKLLAPHLTPMLAASHAASKTMDAWLDKCTTMGAKSLQDVMTKGLSRYRLDKHGNVARELHSRGVSSRERLPRYGYRDSALPLHRLLHSYVSTVVAHYYTSAEKIRQDHEMQSWRADVARQVGGVPGHQSLGFRSVGGDIRHGDLSAIHLHHRAQRPRQHRLRPDGRHPQLPAEADSTATNHQGCAVRGERAELPAGPRDRVGAAGDSQTALCARLLPAGAVPHQLHIRPAGPRGARGVPGAPPHDVRSASAAPQGRQVAVPRPRPRPGGKLPQGRLTPCDACQQLCAAQNECAVA
ncbi:allene oxide synthase-lipoxygenase protein-like [Pollicipes pollicipes]|uniref:allene oxide synthase-lipoxygenase protein-like n=1 Tax=Pollicipes pollicipes TaxID=41117 RepID=UPI0018855B16|nr:allene oxide synthase-lipoxygenase protein-like [Pollicipes pollicipes]